MRTTLNTIISFVGLLANNDTTLIVAIVLLVIINLIPLFVPKDESN